ncbi:unnamed protein product, partial [Tetraodon nigroviridis]
RYYPALRTLEQLERTCLPKAGQYRFCSIMSENIPKLRTQIRDTAMTQLRDFLESIRKHSDKIGETAIKQAQLQRSLDNSVSIQPRPLIGRRSRKEAAAMGAQMDPRKQAGSTVSGQDSGILDVEDEEEDDEVPGAQDLVDFSPVYRCLHIYTVLGLRDVFENYYRKQRRKQARLVLQPHSNMHETLEGYRRYFNQIVGFFVVEDHVLHTTQGLVNRAYVEELWELALSKIIAALRTHSSYCDNPDLVLDLKNLIVLFADTLQGYGFPVSQLFDMLLEMREQYGEILLKRWNITFRQVLDQDNYSSIPVSTEQEYKYYTSQFPLQDPELEKLPFPKKLPFSEFVPKVYCQLKEFIYACLKYSEDLHLSSTEVDDMIRKSTNLLLTRTLSHCLQYAIKKKNVGLAELVQVIINTTHLEQSCHYLEEFISNITNVPPHTANATKLYGTSTFKDARHAAEAEIYTSLNAKIDQFLQLADYDWLVSAQADNTEASDYLIDLIAFLKSTFSVFTNLPGKVAQTACMSACKHISTSLMQLLLDPEVRQISMGALHQLQNDVKECEGFARAGPVAGFQGDTLLMAFSDLRQVGLCLPRGPLSFVFLVFFYLLFACFILSPFPHSSSSSFTFFALPLSIWSFLRLAQFGKPKQRRRRTGGRWGEAAGPLFAVGLVDLPGRLRQSDMQVPESQPPHRFGPSGKVSSNHHLQNMNKGAFLPAVALPDGADGVSPRPQAGDLSPGCPCGGQRGHPPSVQRLRREF